MNGGELEQLSDAELLAVVQGSDGERAERAFEVMYFRHRDFVFRVARRFAGDDELAMDAAQDVFSYLLKKLPRLRLTGKLSTYLYPIARHAGVDRRRKAMGDRRKWEEKARAGNAAIVDEGAEELPEVRRALAGLPEGQREVLLMRVVDGMSVAEVAAALGVPEGTVKSRLFHAMGTLRENGELKHMWGEIG